MFGLFSMGWVGGGDAKLAAVLALWIGAEHTLAYLVSTDNLRRSAVAPASAVSVDGPSDFLSPRVLDRTPTCIGLGRSLRDCHRIGSALHIPSTRWVMIFP
jgi:hypothetical protein